MRPGDVAVIVRPWVIDHDIGRPVAIVRKAIPGERGKMRSGGETAASGSHVAWLCDAAGPEFPCFIAAACLRPFRDSEGEDEILRIAGKPCDIKTPEAA